MCSRIGRLPSKKTKPRLETHRSVIGRVPSQLDPDWPMTAQSANTHASPWAEHPSRCAHGPGRGDYATPSRPSRLSAYDGGAACVTAVRVSGTDGYQLRQCSAPLTCPVRRGGGACSGLPPRQEPINSWGYFFCFVLVLAQRLVNTAVYMRVRPASSRRNERRVFGSENGTVFARCRLSPPHRVRSREGKAKSKTRLPLQGLLAS